MLLHLDSSRLRHFAREESGVTAVEYGVMVALIGLTIFAAVRAVGQGINTTLYSQIVAALQNMGKWGGDFLGGPVTSTI